MRLLTEWNKKINNYNYSFSSVLNSEPAELHQDLLWETWEAEAETPALFPDWDLRGWRPPGEPGRGAGEGGQHGGCSDIHQELQGQGYPEESAGEGQGLFLPGEVQLIVQGQTIKTMSFLEYITMQFLGEFPSKFCHFSSLPFPWWLEKMTACDSSKCVNDGCCANI